MPRQVAERADTLPALAECFREHGYEGASLSLISLATGLGRGSLYHFFPGGKAEMAEAVLAEIDGWFEREVFGPLRLAAGPDAARAAIEATFRSVEAYFRSGRRVCLVGVVALGQSRDLFGERVAGYFARWIAALATALGRIGLAPGSAHDRAEEAVAAIQGLLVLARALREPAVFVRGIERVRERVLG